MAQQVLTQFQEHADAWMRVPDIMEGSSFPQSKVRKLAQFRAQCTYYSLYVLVHRAADP